ncbi:MAG: phage head closure protein [Alicyclobacillus sp.]|nr:phage head closure protein [Alicyclobacillus sp.]
MDPGQLRHRLTLQKRTSTTSANGWPTETDWQDVATVWAAIVPVKGKEFWAAAAVNMQDTVQITIRYRADVTPNMRGVWNGHIYNFIAVQDSKTDHTQLVITAREDVGASGS